jgi:hypothetical protein
MNLKIEDLEKDMKAKQINDDLSSSIYSINS